MICSVLPSLQFVGMIFRNEILESAHSRSQRCETLLDNSVPVSDVSLVSGIAVVIDIDMSGIACKGVLIGGCRCPGVGDERYRERRLGKEIESSAVLVSALALNIIFCIDRLCQVGNIAPEGRYIVVHRLGDSSVLRSKPK